MSRQTGWLPMGIAALVQERLSLQACNGTPVIYLKCNGDGIQQWG